MLLIPIPQSGEAENQFLEYDGYIDLGKELSVLHSLLVESLAKHEDTATSDPKLSRLSNILNTVSMAFDDPTVGQRRRPTGKDNRKSQIYDNMMQTPSPTKEIRDITQVVTKVRL